MTTQYGNELNLIVRAVKVLILTDATIHVLLAMLSPLTLAQAVSHNSSLELNFATSITVLALTAIKVWEEIGNSIHLYKIWNFSEYKLPSSHSDQGR